MSIRKGIALSFECIIFIISLILLAPICLLCAASEAIGSITFKLLLKTLQLVRWSMEMLERWGNKHV